MSRLIAVAHAAWSALRVAWWMIPILVAVVVLVIYRRRERAAGATLDDAIDDRPVSFSTTARERAERALVDMRIDAAIVMERSDARRKELEGIRAIDDDRERLARLARALEVI